MRWMNVWCINVLVASLVDSVLCQCLDLRLSSVLLQLFFSLNLFHIWTHLGSYTSFVLRGLCLSEGCHQFRGHVAQLHSRTSKKNLIK